MTEHKEPQTNKPAVRGTRVGEGKTAEGKKRVRDGW